MAVRIVKGSLVITIKSKPQVGDFMCCFAHGILDHESGKYKGRGHYLSFHNDSPVAKINALCEGTEKVIFFLKLPKVKVSITL